VIVSRLKPHALNLAAFAWGFAEGTLFFIVPDVLLSAIGLTRGAKAGVIASLCAAIGAGAGGALMYAWAGSDPAGAYAAVLAVPAISAGMGETARAAMAENWFLATLAGPLSSTPFKLFAVLAPESGAGFAAFALAGTAARLPRFVVIAVGAALLQAWLEPVLGRTRLRWALAGGWVLFYVAFFGLMPN
jgi:hypothetical protein